MYMRYDFNVMLSKKSYNNTFVMFMYTWEKVMATLT